MLTEYTFEWTEGEHSRRMTIEAGSKREAEQTFLAVENRRSFPPLCMVTWPGQFKDIQWLPTSN